VRDHAGFDELAAKSVNGGQDGRLEMGVRGFERLMEGVDDNSSVVKCSADALLARLAAMVTDLEIVVRWLAIFVFVAKPGKIISRTNLSMTEQQERTIQCEGCRNVRT
jgi:hypothetical protein